jgi:hypothetical protein
MNLKGIPRWLAPTFVLLLASCQQQKKCLNFPRVTADIQLQKKSDDIYFKASFQRALKNGGVPKFVVRVPNIKEGPIEQEDPFAKDKMYASIEKEFVKSSFVIHDRTLFKKVEEKNLDNYEDLAKATDTDYILEFIDTQKEGYRAENYLDCEKKPVTIHEILNYKGNKATFRIIRIKTNDIVGLCTIQIPPKTPCALAFNKNGFIDRKYYRKIPEPKCYDITDVSEPSASDRFYSAVSQRLIWHIDTCRKSKYWPE